MLFAIGIYLFSGLTADSTQFDVIWRLVIAGAGMGMTMAPTIGASVRAVPFDKVGISSGITNMTRTIGMVLGVAIFVTLLNTYMTHTIEDAKETVITMIQSSEQLSSQAKEKLKAGVLEAETSQYSQGPSKQTILQMINEEETEVLSQVPEEKRQEIRAQFSQQKQAISELWPKIQTEMTDAVVNAFQSTFRWGSYLTLLGIIFAYFSDPTKSRRKEDSNVDEALPAAE